MQIKYDHIILPSDRYHICSTLAYLKALYDSKKIDKIKKCSACGTSVIPGLLLICGMNPEQIVSFIIEKRIYNEPIDTIKIYKILSKLLYNYYGDHVPTMYQLYELTQVSLYLCIYNATNNKVEYISYKTHPHINCIIACIMAFHTPIDNTKYTYCGSEYIDASFINPIPNDTVESQDNALCVYAITNPKSFYEVSKVGEQSESKWLWNSNNKILNDQLTRNNRLLLLAHSQLVRYCIDCGPRNIHYNCLKIDSLNTDENISSQYELIEKYIDGRNKV